MTGCEDLLFHTPTRNTGQVHACLRPPNDISTGHGQPWKIRTSITSADCEIKNMRSALTNACYQPPLSISLRVRKDRLPEIYFWLLAWPLPRLCSKLVGQTIQLKNIVITYLNTLLNYREELTNGSSFRILSLITKYSHATLHQNEHAILKHSNARVAEATGRLVDLPNINSCLASDIAYLLAE